MKTKLKAKNKEEAKATQSFLKSGLCAALVVSLALMAFTMTASAGVINVPGDQATIQAAINAAGTGDTIIVHDGTWKENLVVNKSNIIIRSANGSAVTIISSNQTNTHVVDITDQRNVTLDNFTIRDAHGTSGDVAGIYMHNASECTISNTVVTNVSGNNAHTRGIWLDSSTTRCNLTSNLVTNISATGTVQARGIHLRFSDNNTFSTTTVSNVTAGDNTYGINTLQSNNNRFSTTTVSNVTATALNAFGITIGFNSNNNSFETRTVVSNVTATQGATGIEVDTAARNRFDATVVSGINGTSALGVSLRGPATQENVFNDTTIRSLRATEAVRGVYGYRVINNRFTETAISDLSCSRAYGVYLYLDADNNSFTGTSISNLTAVNDTYGVYLEDANDNNFISTAVANLSCNNSYGISLSNSNNNSFTTTTVSDLNAPIYATGIGLVLSNDNNFSGRTTLTDLTAANAATGIFLFISRANSFETTFVSYLDATSGDAIGIQLAGSSHDNLFSGTMSISQLTASDESKGVDVIVSNNNRFNSDKVISQLIAGTDAYGIFLSGADLNEFYGFTIFGLTAAGTTTTYGVHIGSGSDNNTIAESEIRDNNHGIWIEASSGNTIIRNMIINNSDNEGADTGVHVTENSDWNRINENCFYDNVLQAFDDGSGNNWDRNFWSPPPGVTGDYTIPGGAESRDYYPLTYCPMCTVQVPVLTPQGILALLSVLSVVLAVSVRLRRMKEE